MALFSKDDHVKKAISVSKGLLKTFGVVSIACLLCLATACVPIKNPTRDDPFESYNRVVFQFNYSVDRHFYRPIATTYTKIVPPLVQRGIANVFNNFDDIPAIFDDLLEGDFRHAVGGTFRFIVNSTIGVGGIFDFATRMGVKRYPNDMGLVFARWGGTRSPYFLIPFWGPLTVRDLVGLPIDYYGLSAWPYIKPVGLQIGLLALDYTRIRANYLSADTLIDTSFSPYIFVRDAYLQHRQQDIQRVMDSVNQQKEEFRHRHRLFHHF